MSDKTYSVDEIRKTYKKAYAPWLEEEDNLLKNVYLEFVATRFAGRVEEEFIDLYAKKLERKPSAIRARIAKLFNIDLPVVYKIEEKNKSEDKKPQKKVSVSSLESTKELDFNPEFKRALSLLEESDKNVFITGRAGTGKSTLLTYFRNKTKKKVVVLAPTGVAALNVKGQTIHSFFKFKPGITLQGVKKVSKKGDETKNLYRKLDAIVIDEISMVRSDLLDCVDKFLRLNRDDKRPFGGLQMIFIGDLYQLPPVVTGDERKIFRTHYKSQYFFDAKVFEQLQFEFVELEKIYRQKEDDFIMLLNAIRNNSATEEHFNMINKRYNPHFVPAENNFFVYLTTTNRLADSINEEQLERLKSNNRTYTGNITGSFDKHSLPTEVELMLKVGAQVMMLNNDSQKRWVNGTIGKILDIEKVEEGMDIIVVELTDGSIEEVIPYTWELFHFSFDQESNSLVSQSVGTFTQYPMKLAWAVTIHKAQGKTFDNVIIDIGSGTFVHGQLYVALSRCTTLSGIILRQPISKKHIFMDWRVVRFVTGVQYKKSEENLSLESKIKMLKDAVSGNKKMSIIYLKSNDEKSRRVIEPLQVGEMEYLGRSFLGVEAFDEKRGENRVFRIEKILEMEPCEVEVSPRQAYIEVRPR
ncbi:WYL domain-containing protein [Candidatus Parcubacteria bacterium]|nr:MAG: WYL domain-containing protein [Candidatus Parcubacteria bacterium]